MERSPLRLIQLIPPDRSHIASSELKHCAKHWGVGVEDVQTAMAKVGNSASAVQKELMQRGLIRPAP
jgi:hypothetical protein